MASAMNFDPGVFKSLDANPGGPLELFDKYIDKIELIFELAFRKSDDQIPCTNRQGKKQYYFQEEAMA